MTCEQPPTSFVLYRWTNPKTTCDYPYLAVSGAVSGSAGSAAARDRAILLALGNWGLSFEWGISDEASDWLAQDFAPTGESLGCDIWTVRYLLDGVFAGGSEFGLVTFDSQLRPTRLQLSLQAQVGAEQGPEYLLHSLGHYERVDREAGQIGAVGLGERAVLDVCMAIFTALASKYAALLSEPPPPRYCSSPDLLGDRPEVRPGEPLPLPGGGKHQA